MTPPSAQMAAASWRRSMAPLLERRVGPRKVALDPAVAPATRWNPLLAGAAAGPARDRFVRSAAEPTPLPASDADIAFAPVTQLSRWIEQKALTSERLTSIYLTRIEQFDPKLRCVITLTQDAALAQAKQADAEIAAGKYRGPLHGIPYGVKDLLDTAGIPTTYGAEPFRNRVPTADAAVVRASERGGRGADREAESGRAGAERHLVRRTDDEPVAARRRRVGIERGTRRRDRGGARRLFDRQRDRRQHRRAGDALRRHRPAARPSAAWRAPAR